MSDSRPDQWIPDEKMMQWLYGDIPDLPFKFERGTLLENSRLKPWGEENALELPSEWTPLFVPQYAEKGVLFGTLFGGRGMLSTVFPLQIGKYSRYCIDFRAEFMTIYVCHKSVAGSVELMSVHFNHIGDTRCRNAVYLQNNPEQVFFKFDVREKRLCLFCASRGFVCECTESMRTRALADVMHPYKRSGLSYSNCSDQVMLSAMLSTTFSQLLRAKYTLEGRIAVREDFEVNKLTYRHIQFPKKYGCIRDGSVVRAARSAHAQMYFSSKTPSSALFLTDGATLSDRASDRQNSSSNSARLIDVDGMNSCSECGAQFTRKHDAERHYRSIHLGERNFQCSVCSRRFVHRTHLREHVASVHYKLNPATCPECGKGFVSKSKVNRHILSVHKNQKQYSCGVCGKAFSQRWDFKKHAQKHCI
ncbi:hypothetical protein NDN08_002765 [Rhodosorus marinus]|uniref:C2H2-type domain-containing protein n=1 Tax=Rhodosorus marinus TaxID=101924 RepID=A0AAV8UY56_9RHOD|nr:hypothetical protein NDN08_002765 [Rhodosorus marinus]